jgi:hypothetical protein
VSRTFYWFLLLIASVGSAIVWSGPDRWRAFAAQPHVAALLEHFETARASAQTPGTYNSGGPTNPSGPANPGGPAPVYPSTSNPQRPAFQPTQQQPVQPYAPIQSQAPLRQQDLAPQIKEIPGAQPIMTVGDLVILAEEVNGPINQTLAPYVGKMPPERLAETRRNLIQKSLKQLIPTKLLYGEYLSTVPPEGQTQVTKSLAEKFAQDRLPEMMKKAGVSTRIDLDAKFRNFGTSLERQRQQFIENSIAGQWIQQSVEYDRDVTYDQMLDYYRNNIKEYKVEAKVRWQQISIDFDKAGSQSNAQAQIVKLGNLLWQGAAFDAIAKQHSHGFKADEGGNHDWVTRGALASQEIDAAVFSLPVGQLSRIIRDDKGLHIVKVLESVKDGTTPFTDAQGDIKQTIVKKRRKDAVDTYLARLRDQAEIWTIFDDTPAREISSSPTAPPQR